MKNAFGPKVGPVCIFDLNAGGGQVLTQRKKCKDMLSEPQPGSRFLCLFKDPTSNQVCAGGVVLGMGNEGSVGEKYT